MTGSAARILLLGRAGSGKTLTLLDAVAEAIRAGRDDRTLLLVPTYGRGEHLKRLLLSRLGDDPPGFLDRSVLTFTSLAERVLGGTPIGALASPVLRDRLALRALEAPGTEPFAAVRRFPGFRGRFLALVKEVKEAALPEGEAFEALDALARGASTAAARRRAGAFAAAYRAYAALLGAEGRLDHEDFQALLLRRLRDGPPPAALAAVRWLGVDGFTDFTALQAEVVDLLAAGVAEAVVTLPYDPGRKALFAPSAATRERFREWTPRVLRGSLRFPAGSDLARLEEALFRDGEAGARPPDGTVRVLVGADPADEADRVARTAALWIRRDGFAAREILVVHRSLASARPLLEEAFARHGVPLAASAPRSLPAEPSVRAALARARAAVEGVAGPMLPGAVRGLVLGVLPGAERTAAAAAALGALVRAVAEAPDATDPAAFVDGLGRVVARGSFQPRDRRLHAVNAVDAEEARQWEARGVILCGLEEKVFPRPPREDLFLRDEDRRSAGERLRLGLHLDRREEERLLFYTACTRARERLVLSFAAAGPDGERRLPSSFLEEAERIWPADAAPRSVSRPADPAPVEGEEVHRLDLLRGALLRVREPAVRGTAAFAGMQRAGAVLDALARRSKGRRDPDLARAAALAADPDPRIPRRARMFRTSASALAAHGQCRYLHFARHVLRLEPPARIEEEGLDPLRLGTAAHAALEAWFRGGRAGDPGALFDAALAAAMEGVRPGLDDIVLSRRAREALVAFAAFEGDRVDRRAPLLPVAMEASFRKGGAYPALLLRAGGRPVEVRGQFDRVDVDPAGNAVVVDYKMGFSGRKYGAKEHEAALADGDPQVPLYLAALRDAAGLRPAGVEIADVANRRVSGIRVEGAPASVAGDEGSVVLPREGIDALVRALAARAGAAAAALARGDVAPWPADPDRCGAGKCDFADLCRFEKVRLAGRRP